MTSRLRTNTLLLTAALLASVLALCVSSTQSRAFEAKDFPYPGTQIIHSKLSFSQLAKQLDKAVEASKLAVVTRASASGGAERRGVKIPGNMVVGVFRNDYAVRMLKASVPAGIEAPIRFYLTEDAGGTATLTYRKPSAIFAPYKSAELDAMAKELDPLYEKIAKEATESR